MSRAGAPDRSDALIWWLGAGLLVAVTLASRYLVPVDETRYAAVAWEMWQRGDLLVPYLNGEPYSHKPPLLFWLLQAGWALAGVNDWWPRVEPGLVSVATLYLVATVGRQLWPQQPRVGAAAATMVLGLALWAFFTPVLMFDLLLATTVLVALLGVLRAAAGSPAGWVLAGVGLGLGVLTKGPVALLHVLPAALLAPWWALPAPRRWGRWYAGVAGMVVLAAAVALAWAVPAALRGGDQYAQAIFWGQTAGRVVESFAHQRAWWWYLQWLPVVLFPWVLWWPLWRAAARQRALIINDRGVRFCLAWALPVMLAFMAVSGKQLHYLLPLLPAAALAGVRLLQLDETPAGGLAQAPLTLVYVVLGALLIVLPGLQAARGWPAWVADIPMPAGIALMAVGVGLLAPPGPIAAVRRLRIVTLGQLAAVAVLVIAVMGPASPYYDTRPTAGLLAQAQADGRPVAHVGKYHGQFHFPGRLTRPLVEIGRAQVLEWARANPRGLIVAYDDGGKDIVPPRFSQHYRGSRLVVYAAGTVVDHPQLIRSLSD
jgi:4-amino-4-deoxy-L-arabinose transferase-like glycosyltransferase